MSERAAAKVVADPDAVEFAPFRLSTSWKWRAAAALDRAAEELFPREDRPRPGGADWPHRVFVHVSRLLLDRPLFVKMVV